MANCFNKNKLSYLTGAILGAALLSPAANAGELSAEVGIASDYRFRGVSQTDSGIQGSVGVDYAADNGFFIGAWGSNVDFGPDDSTKVELDIFGGYFHEFNDDMSVDMAIYRYNYLGETTDFDYLEGTVGLNVNNFRAAYWYTNDYTGTSLIYQYLELNYSWPFFDTWSLDFHVGNNFGEAVEDGIGENYTDYSVGISTEFAGFGVAVAWLDTTISSEYEVTSDLFNTEGTVLGSISYAF